VTIASIQRSFAASCGGNLHFDYRPSIRETLQITDRSYIIDAGKVMCHGTPDEVLSNRTPRKRYFGEESDMGREPQPERSAVRQ